MIHFLAGSTGGMFAEAIAVKHPDRLHSQRYRHGSSTCHVLTKFEFPPVVLRRVIRHFLTQAVGVRETSVYLCTVECSYEHTQEALRRENYFISSLW